MGWKHVSTLWEDEDTKVTMPIPLSLKERVGINMSEDNNKMSEKLSKTSYADVVRMGKTPEESKLVKWKIEEDRRSCEEPAEGSLQLLLNPIVVS